MRDYLLGLATPPAVAAAGWVLYLAAKAVAALTARAFRGLPVTTAGRRAAFAGACACSRRIYTLSFGGASLVLTLGFRPDRYDEIYSAVYGVLAPKATVNPKWLRRGTPSDPGVEFPDDADGQFTSGGDDRG